MEHKKVDFVYLGRLITANRKLYYKVVFVAAFIGIVISLSIPKSYVTRVTMVSDTGSSSVSGAIGAMASLVGVRLGEGEEQTFYPDIYPDIVGSDDFISSLWGMKVRSIDNRIDTTLYHYIDKCQKTAWWGYPLKGLSWAIGLISGGGSSSVGLESISKPLTEYSAKQDGIAKNIRNMIKCSIDQKTDLISIEVEAQDPQISAQVADSVQKSLQNFIIRYKTGKACSDLEYMQKLYDENKAEYEEAQREYSRVADANTGLVLKSAGVRLDFLENNMQLKYTVFSDIAQQLELAKAKVQEQTPVFAVIQSPSIHLKKTKPRRSIIVLSFILLSFIGTTFYLLNKDGKIL